MVPLFRRGGKKNKDDTMGRVPSDRATVIMETKAEAAVTKRQQQETSITYV